jgi:hypothetical protein
MRHDVTHESGDNLTLREWLELGKVSGRGLKLDFKETDLMPAALDAIAGSGVPHERLMFNLGYGAMQEWGSEIRRRIKAESSTTNTRILSIYHLFAKRYPRNFASCRGFLAY